MYRLLVIDDEHWIRKGLVAKVRQLGLGFDAVFEAGTVQEALEIIEREQPDIALTDIRLSDQLGLDLIAMLRDRGHEMEFILISGYAEFTYAQAALKLGVSDYLVKPVQTEALRTSLLSAIDRVGRRESVNAIRQRNESYVLGNHIHLLLSSVGAPSQESCPQVCSHLPLFTLPHHQLMLWRVSNAVEDLASAKAMLHGWIKKTLEAEGLSVYVIDSVWDQRQIIVVQSASQRAQLLHSREELRRLSGSDLPLPCCVGVSQIGVINAKLFTQASEALAERLLRGSSLVHDYSEDGGSYQALEEQLKTLQHCLSMDDYASVSRLMASVFSSECLAEGGGGGLIRLFSGVRSLLQQKVLSLECPVFSTDLRERIRELRLDSFETLADMGMFFRHVAEELQSERASCQDCTEIVERVKDYLSRNYFSDLRLGDLGRHFAIHPNYLSTLFRRATGMTMTAYLRRCRVEKARELLVLSTASVSDIAKQVGFDNPQYFHRVFRKEVGLTPQDYRCQHGSSVNGD